ncbi:hypothetical protein SCHPADRAFT_859587 [Schizopora paradoxa]|uniref:XRRM domain-containing protein n=1 Tax=Schizopora paradoxa TaxID=27342 RepID=A0A0H2REI4_9AGAM|nr:hypothetical protein SCHPADRAFT_859587 [Schizopora paradoxa]
MSNFDFIPRKLTRSATKPNRSNSASGGHRDATGGPRPTGSASKSVEDTPVPSNGIVHNTPKADWKGKGKETGSGERNVGKALSDEEYCNLLWLSLSDHAIWSSHDLYEEMESRNGFVDLRNIWEFSPLFAALPPASVPPESTLARSAKLNPHFEVRMIVVDSWVTGNSRDRGGYEIRRADWVKVKERIRKYTSFYWEDKTIYVENIPVESRTKPAIVKLVQNLLCGRSDLDSSQPTVERVRFPPHRDDAPDALEPFKCKGFAFVTLSSSNTVTLLDQWPWERRDSSSDSEGRRHKAALESGLRALSKRNWEKLKEEYLLHQQRLLAEAANQNHASAPRASKRTSDDDDESRLIEISRPHTISEPQPPSIPQATYPLDCLVFVKNIQPDTNKTTLKKLFSVAFEDPEGQIDYVDYTKGLDTCHLRLCSSLSARRLVEHFNAARILQSNGLDADGTKDMDSSNVISMELVQGRREELYWEKVPLKIRQQAIAKATSGAQTTVESGLEEDTRKRKRRKHN